MDKITLSLFSDYFQIAVDWLLTSGIRILFIAVLALIAIKAAKLFSAKIVSLTLRPQDEELKKRANTLGAFVRYVSVIAIALIAAMMILGEMRVDIGPILAGAGVLGLAIGFGAQSLVKDWLSGFFILLEDQFRVGDVVEVGGKGGLVEEINLRMTILRDLNGNVHYVRNGQIDTVTNMTKDYSRYVFNIGVAYREDVDEVMEVIKLIDEGLRNDPEFKDDILQPLEVMGVDQFADSAVIIKARTTTKPIKQWRIGREFNRRLKKKFDELGIEIPYPHLTLYMGSDKEGASPPLRVALNESRGKTQD
ncbi:MAG: mechanosensitive ion channel family protein [Deltaproteobacteria bacterium HGW-Deltaproteobacteria-15]|jgi:small conductance mechanosensitive channel|nr:MAG: mechanosensitive ion channel family protein [Deltaproteobacteria bacterium HGW-Deltaproteobacteria-15]